MSSGETSKKTESCRCRAVRSQRKRNRSYVGRRHLKQNVSIQISDVEMPGREISKKTESSRSRAASPRRKQNRGGLVPSVLNEHSDQPRFTAKNIFCLSLNMLALLAYLDKSFVPFFSVFRPSPVLRS